MVPGVHRPWLSFSFSLFFRFRYFGSGLKGQPQHHTRYSLTPRKPIASSIHSLGFPSIVGLGGGMPNKRVSSTPREKLASVPMSCFVLQSTNRAISFVAFCTDVADAYVGGKRGGRVCPVDRCSITTVVLCTYSVPPYITKQDKTLTELICRKLITWFKECPEYSVEAGDSIYA